MGVQDFFTPIHVYYVDKSKGLSTRLIRPENKKTFEIVDGGVKETDASKNFIKLIGQYIRSKNERKKISLLKKINKELEGHKFIQYKYKTEVVPEIAVIDAENGFSDLVDRIKKTRKEININDKLLEPLQKSMSDSDVARHYLINGKKGSKMAELKEILDLDELKNKFKKSKRNHKNKINKSEGLTTAGITGLGYYINKNNENDKK